MTVVLGVDPSTKKLAVTITHLENPDSFEMVTIRLPENRPDACATAFRELSNLILELKEETGQPVYVYQEAPVIGRGGPRPTIAQAQVGGAAMAAVAECRGFLFLVNNSTWKKTALGRGNLSKPEIGVELRKVWPEAWKEAAGDLDLIDSAAINLFGEKRLRLRLALLKRVGRR